MIEDDPRPNREEAINTICVIGTGSKCVRCNRAFVGSFSGECPDCERTVTTEWVSTEQCRIELENIC